VAKFTFPSGRVAVAGSRTLPHTYIPLIASISQHIAHSSGSLSVGCCLGVDQAVISSVEPKYLHIHTIFNSRGKVHVHFLRFNRSYPLQVQVLI